MSLNEFAFGILALMVVAALLAMIYEGR